MLNVRAKRLKYCRWRTTRMMGGKPLRISTDETSSSSQSRIFCQPPPVRGREKESRRRRRMKGTRRAVLVSQGSGLSGPWSQAGEQNKQIWYLAPIGAQEVTMSVCPSVHLCGTNLSRAVNLHHFRPESNQRAIREQSSTQRALKSLNIRVIPVGA